MTRALVHCHQREVLHLDLKPANVLVTKGICKLRDFGCSVSMSKCGTPVGTKVFLVGTPGYQAPELLLGKSPAAACDVMSSQGRGGGSVPERLCSGLEERAE